MFSRALFLFSLLPALLMGALLKEGYVEADGARLFYRQTGEGAPLVLLHGGPGMAQDYFLPFMEQLATDHCLLFYDQRGCGRSTGNAEALSMETFTEDLEAIRQELNVEKISLLGHSWGGFVAMHYALAHPEHVDKLILSNTMPASSEGLTSFLHAWSVMMAPFKGEFERLRTSKEFREGDPVVVEAFYRLLFQNYCALPSHVALLNLKLTRTASVSGAKIYESVQKNILGKPFNLLPSLEKLKVPTLILHGAVDPIPQETAFAIHKSIPDSRYILIERCGHFPFVEDPTTYFSCINLFLSEQVNTMQHSLLEAVLQGRRDFVRSCSLYSSLPGSAFHETPSGLCYYSSGIDYAPCNGVIGGDTPSEAEIEEACRFFGNHSLPFIWWSSAKELEKKGFQFGGIFKGIALPLSQEIPTFSSPVEIKIVETEEELETFATITVETSGMSSQAKEQLQTVFLAGMDAGEQVHFLALVEGKGVGTATLSTSRGSAGIWNLATLPPFRKQGAGTALIQAALIEAKRRGHEHVMAILMPKGLAWGIFTKFGFQEVLQFPFYVYGSGELEK